jgi:hypothetical protein
MGVLDSYRLFRRNEFSGLGHLAYEILAKRLNLHETVHFNASVVKAGMSVATPGVANATAMAPFGQINLERACQIQYAQYHVIKDGSGGTTRLELWRQRSGSFMVIGSVEVAAGGGDFQSVSLNVTKPMTGGAQGGIVDVHFADDIG